MDMSNITMEELSKLISVKEVAELFGIRAGVVRKAARKNEIPGHISILGKSGFDPEEVLQWTPPEPGERVVGVKREDGRRRYRIYLLEDEKAKLQAEGYEVSDPRVEAKARRAARKAAKAGSAPADAENPFEEASEGDPFTDFGS